MKLKYIYLFVFLIVFFTSCNKKNVIPPEIKEIYRQEINKINKRWQMANSAFETFNPEKNEKEVSLYKLNTIESFVLPKFYEIKNNIEQLNIQNKQIQKIHVYYIISCEEQINFFELISEYLKTREDKKLEQANSAFNASVKNYNSFIKLCRTYDIIN